MGGRSALSAGAVGPDRSSCPICCRPAQPLVAIDGYSIRRCSHADCGHGFLAHGLSADDAAVLYSGDESALHNGDAFALAEDYERDPAAIRRVLDRARLAGLRRHGLLPPSTRLLDVGCGTGALTRVLQDQGFEAEGCDLNDECVRVGRERLGVNIHRSLDAIAPASFDVATLYGVVEHSDDPAQFLREVASKVRPGGSIVMLVPNFASPYRRLAGRSWLWWMPPFHLHHFTPASATQLARDVGVQVVALETGYGGTYLYLVVHHLLWLVGKRELPSTSRTSSRWRAGSIAGAEALLRLLMAPFSRLARRHDGDLELTLVLRVPEADAQAS